jgi:membrane protease YdiL (CAAX protease family)
VKFGGAPPWTIASGGGCEKIIFSADGRIRFMWRLTLYFALFLAIAAIAYYGIRRPLTEGLGTPLILGNLIFAVFYIAAVTGLTAFLRRRVGRKPWSGMALGSFRNRWMDFLGGLILACAMTGLVFLVGGATEGMRLAGIQPQPWGVGAAAVFLLAAFIFNFAVAFPEELAMRGYIVQISAGQLPIWFALLLNGWIFGFGHFTSADFSVFTVLLMSIAVAFLAFTRLSTGSVWLAVGWHTGWNLMQYDVLGVWKDGLWNGKLSDPDAWGGNQLLVLLLADVLFLLLLCVRRNRIRLRGKLAEDGSPAMPLPSLSSGETLSET